ncbi:MAG: 3-hydroxyacyl-CoA dehydrogenase family protein [Bacteriovoracaceae bacterium]
MIDYILCTPDHPHFERVKVLPNYIDLVEIKKDFSLLNERTVLDLTLLPPNQKEELLSDINKKSSALIYSDLGAYYIPKYKKICPALKLCFNLNTYSPKNKFELLYSELDDHKKEFTSWAQETLSLESFEIKVLNDVFPLSQTLAMIINEAYFSLEDGLCTKEDIDTAMKYGVNYPLGPFEWADKGSLKSIVYLLDDLFEAKKDKRYACSELLRQDI